jgi:hypothetical protein
MSFARFSECDVYLYADVAGYVCCCGCALGDKWDYHSPEEVVAHMEAHRAAGHAVPDRLFDTGLYDPKDFIAMCTVFMCHKDAGHEGEHTPLSAKMAEQGARIRASYGVVE